MTTTAKPLDMSLSNDDRFKERLKEQEQELQELENSRNKKEDPEPDPKVNEDGPKDENLDVEEKTYKKRYGDLRRHTQQIESTLKAEINQLKEKLEAASAAQVQLPANESELEDWIRSYPDIARVIETMILKKVQAGNPEIQKINKNLEDLKRQQAKEKAYYAVLKKHPDLPEIVNSEEYQMWLQEQPSVIYDALVNNETDAPAAIKALDLYKYETNKAKKKTNSTDAAKSITKSNTPSPNSNGPKMIRESEVQNMHINEYQRREEEIMTAIREGRFIYDISGGAR